MPAGLLEDHNNHGPRHNIRENDDMRCYSHVVRIYCYSHHRRGGGTFKKWGHSVRSEITTISLKHLSVYGVGLIYFCI